MAPMKFPFTASQVCLSQMLKTSLAAMALIVVVGCNYNELKAPVGGQRSQGATPGQPGTASVDYATVKSQVFEPYCIRCHGNQVAKGQVNLEVYSNAFQNSRAIRDDVETDSMPAKGPKVPPELKALLFAWIDSGSPETTVVTPGPGPAPGPVPTPGPLPAPTTLDFATVKQHVFEPYCIRCHGNQVAKHGVNLETYATAFGELHDAIELVDSDEMPTRGPKVPQDLKDFLRAWVAAGAPE